MGSARHGANKISERQIAAANILLFYRLFLENSESANRRRILNCVSLITHKCSLFLLPVKLFAMKQCGKFRTCEVQDLTDIPSKLSLRQNLTVTEFPNPNPTNLHPLFAETLNLVAFPSLFVF